MRFAMTIPLLALALMGCNNGAGEDTGPEEDTFVWPDCEDADGDGRCAQDEDCDDSDPEVHAGRREICNDIDDNCNGLVDEGMPDADQDGTCDLIDTEECDGLDNDGDNLIDEECPDSDGDGIADQVDVEECDGVDNDGDDDIDEDFDADNDGYTICGDIDGADVDCDDDNRNVYPGATETADTTDNDCDGLVDEGGWLAGDLVINEIMVNPNTVGDPSGEWFELYNGSGKSVYLNGLQLRDSNGQIHQILDDDLIEVTAGDYAVLGVNGRIDLNGRVPVDYEYDTITLANGVDDLQLWVIDQTSTGEERILIDQVSWDETFENIAGSSFTLEPDFADADSNDDRFYWCAATAPWDLGTDLGSPGQENPICASFDHDFDGWSVTDGDCDDDDDEVYPGAPEIDGTIDNDCDGDAELGPVVSARVGDFSSDEVCGEVYLDASATRDPDGGTVESFEWTMTAAPTGSKLDSSNIHNADRDLASFEPDVDGTYEFEVVAFDDGDAAGQPDTVTVEVDPRSSNTAPVADAGDNYVARGTTTCVDIGGGKYSCTSCKDLTFDLDGSSSRDYEGDSLTYLWSVTSGAGVVEDRTAEETTVTVSGATPTKGGKATSTVFIDLVVTDCMGAASTADTLAIVYTCEAP